MISTDAAGVLDARAASSDAETSHGGVRQPTAVADVLLFANTTLRNLALLAAVLATNYTLSRPSPVDFLFLVVLVLCFAPSQRITTNSVVFFCLLLAWISSVVVSSITLIDNPNVVFTLVALGHVVLIALATCLVAIHWDEAAIHRFLRVYIVSTCIASLIGVVGFVTKNDLLTWDDRARAFLDDPNMFSAFLIPGVLACLYMMTLRRSLFVYTAALGILLIGILVGFSRAAVGSLALWGTIWMIFLNRRNLAKAAMYALLLPVILVVVGGVADFVMGDFAAKLSQRSTLSMEYDRGQGGRYNRYFLSLSFILDNPLGMGLFEIDKYFPEPIHNFWLSSFMNYGWLAGVAWTVLVALSFRITHVNYRQSESPLCILFFVSWMSIFSCALLHQAERWRFFWMFAGLLWGLNVRNLQPAAEAAGRAAR